MKTLIADDEVVSRKKLAKILDPLGECRTVDNGRSAVEAFKKAWSVGHPFDLICLDISMPEMDGLDVLFEIRNRESKLRVEKEKPSRVLMITSHSDQDSVITAIQAGCDGYLVKPFDHNSVMDKIRSLGFRIVTD